MTSTTPQRFSARVTSRETEQDTITVHGWADDGQGEGPAMLLTHDAALDLIARVSAALATAKMGPGY